MDGKWHDGETLGQVFEIPKKSGDGMTDRISFKRAFEMGFKRSVTSKTSDVLGKSYQLVKYKENNCVLATSEHGMEDGEEWDDYTKRIRDIAGEMAGEARDRGKELHLMLQEFVDGKGLPHDPAGLTICNAVQVFSDTCECSGTESEKTLTDGGSTCGTPDLFIGRANLHKVCAFCDAEIPAGLDEYGEVIIDLKSKDFKGKKKITIYPETEFQVGAYGTMRKLDSNSLFVVLQADRETGDTRFVLLPDTKTLMENWVCLNTIWKNQRGWTE